MGAISRQPSAFSFKAISTPTWTNVIVYRDSENSPAFKLIADS